MTMILNHDDANGTPLVIALPNPTIPGGAPVLYDTGLRGMMYDGWCFLLPFRDDMTMEEVSRIVAQAIKREGE